MRIIDIHTHVFPDKIAKETVQKMAQEAGAQLSGDGTIEGLISSMDQSGVDLSVTLPVATRPEQVESINSWVMAHMTPRIIPFGAMHPDYLNPYSELERIKAAGFRGIKLHPDYQGFYPDEERLKPVFQACVDLDLIILFHSGDDIGHPRPGHSLPRKLAGTADAYNTLTIIFAHLGGFEMWDQAEKYLVGKPVYLDTSYSLPYMPAERAEKIIKNHGAERVLLGSDSPWGDIADDIRRINSLSLSGREKELILGGNAERLLHL